MTHHILDKRYSKVTRLLNYMLNEKNDAKILQCYHIINLINERRSQLMKSRENYLNNYYGKTN